MGSMWFDLDERTWLPKREKRQKCERTPEELADLRDQRRHVIQGLALITWYLVLFFATVALAFMLYVKAAKAEPVQLTTYNPRFGLDNCQEYPGLDEFVVIQIEETDVDGAPNGTIAAERGGYGLDAVGLFAWAELPSTQFTARTGYRPKDENGWPTGDPPVQWSYVGSGCPGEYLYFKRTPVPEPPPALALVVGLAGLTWMGRSRIRV